MIDTIPCHIEYSHMKDCDGRYLEQLWLPDGTDDLVEVPCNGCCVKLVCAEAVRGMLEHELPHCRECGRVMRPGALRTQPGGNRRYWICESCIRYSDHVEIGQDARISQRVLI